VGMTDEKTSVNEEEITLEIERLRADLRENGFTELEEFGALHPGRRVHHVSQEWARGGDGTATIVHVLRRGSDEKPDGWEQKWGRPNIEVIVRRDEPQFGRLVGTWTDYHTVVVVDEAEAAA